MTPNLQVAVAKHRRCEVTKLAKSFVKQPRASKLTRALLSRQADKTKVSTTSATTNQTEKRPVTHPCDRPFFIC